MLNKRGFTLIETLIYVAIIGLVSSGLMKFSMSITSARNKTYVIQEVHANVRDAVVFINKKIQEANGINLGSSTFDTDPGVLSLSMSDNSKNPTIISLDEDNGKLQVVEGLSDPIFITTEEVLVNNLQFSNVSTGDEARSIQFNLTIDYDSGVDATKDFTFSQSSENLASIRN
ncbi:MAG: type II secretion system protein [Candidatus Magasanikbacteria bacterium]